MARTFFGFALADSMFEGDCAIMRKVVDAAFVREKAVGLIQCLNPSHQATIDTMRRRFDIEIAVPEAPPKVALSTGDAVIVMGVRGLPRLTDRHEYTAEEIAGASFAFSVYTVTK